MVLDPKVAARDLKRHYLVPRLRLYGKLSDITAQTNGPKPIGNADGANLGSVIVKPGASTSG